MAINLRVDTVELVKERFDQSKNYAGDAWTTAELMLANMVCKM